MSDQEKMILKRVKIICRIALELEEVTMNGLLGKMRLASFNLNGFLGTMP